jgi:ABC-type hemin transport system ATPase subunit
MRYGVAILVAVLIVAAIGLFAWQARRQLEQQIGQAAQQQGDHLESVHFHDFYVKLPGGQQARVDLARLLASTWYVWMPVVVMLCLGGAVIVGWIKDRRRSK